MSWPVSTVLDSIIYGSSKLDAVEVLFTTNEDPYFLRIWEEGRSKDLGYFPSWDACIQQVREQQISKPIGEIVAMCGIKVGNEVVAWEFANADYAEVAAADPDSEVLYLEDMADPKFQKPNLAPKI